MSNLHSIHEYYPVPFPFGNLTQGKPTGKVPLPTSIWQHLSLILTTCFGEYRYDPAYGCIILEHDFDVSYTLGSWQNRVEESIKEVLESQEKRLTDLRVKVALDEEEWQREEDAPGKKRSRVKKRIRISVSGRLKATNEQADFQDFVFFFSPISSD